MIAVAWRASDGRAAEEAPAEVARTLAARGGLVYVGDDQPGIRRRSGRNGFLYYLPSGGRLSDAEHVAWIDSLAIPPAWQEVWICSTVDGHIQATGRDDRDRKQYRYHPRWTEIANRTKFDGLADFAALLPRIRRRVRRDLSGATLSRDRVLAAVVRLLDRAHVRIGNDGYTAQSKTYGATTLRHRHVHLDGQTIDLHFRGKHGVDRRARLTDRLLTRLLRDLQELPGQRLFCYLDARNQRHAIHSETVNDYLRAISGRDITAKDFRTWHGTRAAFEYLRDADPEMAARRAIAAAARAAADDLGNTVAVCKKYYVHPLLADLVQSGGLAKWRRRRGRTRREMTRTESILLDLLRAAEREPSPPPGEVALRAAHSDTSISAAAS